MPKILVIMVKEGNYIHLTHNSDTIFPPKKNYYWHLYNARLCVMGPRIYNSERLHHLERDYIELVSELCISNLCV